ncbi:activating signal cointegrator 1-like [Gigantopelta aegis]|uniref:activating signal cointegrator 1-like n=1 Tax=Gigantopelta aegis TaxID=1735272 RepID=UPI001B88D131|nr:activating signal cointegrator 1-like [Gigantopelta aegis]
MSASMMENWMCAEFGKLGIDVTTENARYILAIDSAHDLEDYILELLDGSDVKVQKFVKELLQRWKSGNSAVPNDIKVYKKPNQEEEVYFKGVEKTKKKSKEDTPTKLWSDEATNGEIAYSEDDAFNVSANDQSLTDPTKRKTKFVPLYSQEGLAKTVIKIPGRHSCECQASKHKLINNCMKCGRVVCEQEGSGPCVFCGNLVCTVEEEEILAKGSKKSDKLRQHLMKGATIVPLLSNDKSSLTSCTSSMKQGLDIALKQKERLLDYDKSSVSRTKVIDDEADYFAADSNRWLSAKEKDALNKREAQLRKERHGSRRDRKLTFDFAGRQIIEAESDAGRNMYDINDDVIQQVYYGAQSTETSRAPQRGGDSDIVNPNIVQAAPLFITPEKLYSSRVRGGQTQTDFDPSKRSSRIQDRQLLEMTDEGMCLSMHQPWATLLVKGIKIHEGRTWYTAHRGRLWIAATKQTPETQTIAEVEQQYRFLCNDPHLKFPNHYPIGCLLGCVDVTDCLSQEEYRLQFPDGESVSPYVFICQGPQELIVKFPIQGKHKIYKLDSHIHQAAKKGLRPPSDH